MSALQLLFRGPRLVVVDKPAGLPTVEGRAPGPNVKALLSAQLSVPVLTVHRLDRDTSGALAFALDAAMHRFLSGAFEAGRVEKRYLALVQGVAQSQDIDAGLVEARSGTVRVARPGEAGKAAFTQVELLEAFPTIPASLVACTPRTGRTHQLRVHLASRGHPLLLDHQYGRDTPWTEVELGGASAEVVLARTPLHAQRLKLPLPSGASVTVEAPLPADLERAMALVRVT